METDLAYDQNFYKKYAEYLKERSVRASHDFVFRQFRQLAATWRANGESVYIIDFGCGLGEYYQYPIGRFSDDRYIGIDVNDVNPNRTFKLLQGDYHDLDMIKKELTSPGRLPNAFVSLFSIECFHSVSERYAFYHRIFKIFPSIRLGLTGGFFYESKRSQETVRETGGIVSYQTVEDPTLYISDLFAEFRIHLRTPSEMFGKDVVEVWKFLIRREYSSEIHRLVPVFNFKNKK